MLNPLSFTLALSFFENDHSHLLSGATGFLTAVLGRHFWIRTSVGTTGNQSSPVQEQFPNRSEIDRVVSSIYELTEQVGTHVSQHSLRVSEITDSIEHPDGVESTLVIAACTLLVTANQKLQSDLEDAQREIRLQREQMDNRLQESRTDALTGLSNRRALDHEVDRVFAQQRRESSRFSLLMIDIDHFKRINDQYGHMVGDQVLKRVSQCLTNALRGSDFIARYGGEEFVAILAKTSIDEACKAAERIRKEITATPYKAVELEIPITASIGVKEVTGGETATDFFQKADKALYAAKNGGRNCCYYHDGTTCHRCAQVVVSPEFESGSPSSSHIEIVSEAASKVKIPHLRSANRTPKCRV